MSLWSAKTAGISGHNRTTQAKSSTSTWCAFAGHVSKPNPLLRLGMPLRGMSNSQRLYSLSDGDRGAGPGGPRVRRNLVTERLVILLSVKTRIVGRNATTGQGSLFQHSVPLTSNARFFGKLFNELLTFFC